MLMVRDAARGRHRLGHAMSERKIANARVPAIVAWRSVVSGTAASVVESIGMIT
jgi:hypothetical protein